MTLYWYGGTGNWSDYTNHWSNNSGNSPASPAAAAPTQNDDVIFDANSGTGTCTVNSASNCKGFNASASSLLTITGNQDLNVYGSFALNAGMTFSKTGYLRFKGSGTTNTINFAGVSFAYAYTYFTIDCAAGNKYTLNSDLVMDKRAGWYSKVLILSGTLDTNGYDVTCEVFTMDFNATRGLITGDSVFDTWDFMVGSPIQGTLENFDSGTSTIKWRNNLTASGQTLYDVEVVNQNTNESGAIGGSAGVTVHNFTGTVTSNDEYIRLATAFTLTVTGLFKLTGPAVNNRVHFDGNSGTINAASVDLDNVDFVETNGAGAAAPFTGVSIGDQNYNTGITFTAPKTCYWVADSGSWVANAADHWATSSGGSPALANFPIAQDTVILDDQSFSTTGLTLTVDRELLCQDFDASAVTNSPIFASSAAVYYIYFYGDVTFGTMDVNMQSGIVLYGDGAQTFTQNGADFDGCRVLECNSPTGEAGQISLGGDLNLSNIYGELGIYNRGTGGFDSNGYDISCVYFYPDSDGSTFDLTNSQITIRDSGYTYNGTSQTMTMTGVKFIVPGYADFEWEASFNFNDLEVQTGGEAELGDTYSVNTLTIGAGGTVSLTANKTLNIVNLISEGTALSHGILRSLTPATGSTLKSAQNGLIHVDYLTVTGIKGYTGTPAGYSYTPSATTYDWSTLDAGATDLSPINDDGRSAEITLPFTFSFFGVEKTSCWVHDNILMGFTNNNASGANGYPGSIPTGDYPDYILGACTDLVNPSGGTIKYQTFGSTPNRVFVVEYNEVPVYGHTAILESLQIKLFETSNKVEIHTKSLTEHPSNPWAQGLENAAGTSAIYLAGRNLNTGNLSNDGVKFDSVYTPAVVWGAYYMGLNSTNGGNNTGLIFGDVPYSWGYMIA